MSMTEQVQGSRFKEQGKDAMSSCAQGAEPTMIKILFFASFIFFFPGFRLKAGMTHFCFPLNLEPWTFFY